jgi:hypothetical protein
LVEKVALLLLLCIPFSSAAWLHVKKDAAAIQHPQGVYRQANCALQTRAAAQQLDEEQHNCNYQQYMDKPAAYIKGKIPQQPGNDQYYG